MQRLFPHPGLSGLLAVFWVLLSNSLTWGSVIMAAIVAVAIPLFTSPYWREKPRLRFGWAMVEYLLVVLWDIVVANFEVAWIILTKRDRDLRSAWLVIPLEVEQPEAITALAGTISLTPGTVSTDVSACGRMLLVHALDIDDHEQAVARIKSRYEARLRRIFR
ncbi:Na+/H+ antiporter subunit E [Erythrobacter sp. HL-111]|uniref:Na+/H+ antiporter subunit E n=1 Tax=Erythrobacter sp. HL-111 TaxID=1798193 RepID=UPI0006DB4980|nr:Na+/H+ antiporter subunit E [Erythrobacter sp. HL-111]KPP84946.1 MAG: multicomponent K+:H+ antiporter subunit PhaE [Erythrobacteraceae bacterium HL-111]SDT08383.1 multisubunit potassium/proton antiporter, PhaE subunit [Erythrobacter sp. HL-111]